MAQTFVAMPFLVVSLEGALRTAGQRYEVVAASLGAGPTTVFRRITIPLVLPGLVSGAVLSFARALGEFGATITFAGSLQGRTRTLPLEIYLQRETDPDAAVALALVLVVVAVLVIGFARQAGACCDLRARPQWSPSATSTSPSRWPPGRPWRCSGRTARASRPRWPSPPGWCARTPGRVVLDGRVLTDVGPGRPGVRVPPHARRTALLGQEPLLFPHLDALENVAFGPRSTGTPRATARRDAQRWLDEVGVGELAAPTPGAALGRPGAAGRGGAGAGRRARAAAARRADGGARRRRAARAAADAAAGAGRPDRDRGHPRPARRAAARGPGGGADGRPGGRAGTERGGALAAAQPVRRPAGRAQPGRRAPGGTAASRRADGLRVHGLVDGRAAGRRGRARSRRSGPRRWRSSGTRSRAARATPST